MAADASVALIPGAARYTPWNNNDNDNGNNNNKNKNKNKNKKNQATKATRQPTSFVRKSQVGSACYHVAPISRLLSCTSWAVCRASSNFCWLKRSITVTSEQDNAAVMCFHTPAFTLAIIPCSFCIGFRKPIYDITHHF